MTEKDQTLLLLDIIAQAIYDKKGSNILALDLRGISSMADYFLIAEGNVARHVQALSSEIIDVMHKQGHSPVRTEGRADSDWVIIDYGDILIHLFIPELREKYALEKLWAQGQIVDLNISLGDNRESVS